MSKKAKNNAKRENLKRKRAKKAANTAQYQSWAREGENTKSKRAKSKAKKNRLVNTISHKDGDCGNIGCRRCNIKNHHKWGIL